MATSKDYLVYIQELLRDIPGITFRAMMGEYIFYKDGIVFGGLYDNRFLIKKTKSVKDLGLKEQLPYEGGSLMLLVDSEDSEEIEELINKVVSDLRK